MASSPLADRHCVVCKPGTPTLRQSEIDRFLQELPGWTVVQADGHLQLTRTYKFKGFLPGADMVKEIAKIAEDEGHHPDLHLSYGSLKADLWTHAAGGLTENDFILAAKMDRIQAPEDRFTAS